MPKRPTLILVTGSRSVPLMTWGAIVEDALDSYRRDFDYLFLMHGGCPHPGKDERSGQWMASIDLLAAEWARRNHIPPIPFPALWNDMHKGAGPYRNRLMVDSAKAWVAGGRWYVHVVAFHPNLVIGQGGTGGTVKYALGCGLNVDHYDGNGKRTLPLPRPTGHEGNAVLF